MSLARTIEHCASAFTHWCKKTIGIERGFPKEPPRIQEFSASTLTIVRDLCSADGGAATRIRDAGGAFVAEYLVDETLLT